MICKRVNVRYPYSCYTYWSNCSSAVFLCYGPVVFLIAWLLGSAPLSTLPFSGYLLGIPWRLARAISADVCKCAAVCRYPSSHYQLTEQMRNSCPDATPSAPRKFYKYARLDNVSLLVIKFNSFQIRIYVSYTCRRTPKGSSDI